MKFYGRNNCKLPLDLIIGKHEKIVLSLIQNVCKEVRNRLFFTFVSRKTTENKVMKFVKNNEEVLENIGTSVVKEEEMDNRPIWFDMDEEGLISNKARFTKVISNVDDIIDGILFLKELTTFIYITRDSYSFKKGKHENSNYRK